MAKNKPGREAEEPQTLDDCQDRMDTLVSEIREIQCELGNKNKRGPDGQRLSSKDYHEWRSRATKALRYKQEEHQFLRRWRSKYLKRKLVEANEGKDCTSILFQLCTACRNLLARSGKEGNDDIIETLEDAQGFLRSKGIEC